ncbi:MAG: NAD(P)-binding protein [Aeromicrobium sp.]
MSDPQNQPKHYDLCIVGAGIGGLNALYVASQYLESDQRIVLIDRRDRVGGMWVDTYDYVRLHQPHPFFTTGDVKWTFGKEPSHLASKTEVLDHFRHCVNEAKKGVDVTELLGHEMEDIEETGDAVRVTCRLADGSLVTVTADRVINAVALEVEALKPLTLSSSQVRSVAPETCDMRSGEIAGDNAPVWVIGSGKTGMDTVHALITQQPGREVNLVAGTGTFFLSRDRFYPAGASRWWRGTRPNYVITKMADRFDGTNEHEVFNWVRDTYGTGAIPKAEHFFLGTLSEAESERIRGGLGQVVMDHFVDAVDVDAVDATDDGRGVQIHVRKGSPIDIAPGSWIVNCTSHFTYRERIVNVPYVSPSGRVVTIGTSVMFGFSAFAGYFLAHLLFTGKITEVPLYQADGNAMLRQSTPAAVASSLALSQYNIGLAFDHLPAKVFQGLGLDFDRWYPPPRRLVGQLKFVARHKRQREHYRRSLEKVGQRFGVSVGPVVGVQQVTLKSR